MKPSEDLFNLIKSLTGSEKVQFRKYASRHVIGKKNNYLVLFDKIDAQDKYNEKKLAGELAKTIPVAHLHVTKHYLFKQIIKVLVLTDNNRFIDYELYEMINQISILSEKGLMKTAYRMLKKAKFLAAKHHREHIIFKLLDIETNFILYNNITWKTESQLDEMITLRRRFGNDMMVKAELKNLFDKQNLILKKRSLVRTASDEKKMSDFLNNPVMATANSMLTIESIYYKYVIRIKYYLAKGDLDSYQAAAEEVLSELNTYSDDLIEQPTFYFSLAMQYLDYTISTGQIAAFEKRLDEYQRIYRQSKKGGLERRYLAEQKLTFLGLMLKYYEKLYDPDNFIKTAAEMAVFMDENTDALPPRRVLSMSIPIAEMMLIAGFYENALVWTDKIINHPAHPAKEDNYKMALVLRIATQYEMGDYELMEYTIANAEKYYRKRKSLLSSERTLLKFFKMIPNITQSEKIIEEFNMLKKKMNSLEEDEKERPFYNRFRVNRWIERKLNRLHNNTLPG